MNWTVLFALSALANVIFAILLVRAEVLLGKRTKELLRASRHVAKYDSLVHELQIIGKDEASLMKGVGI